MKYIYALLFALLVGASVQGQNCTPTFTLSAAPIAAHMYAPAGFANTNYVCTWTFSDGICMYGSNPVHSFLQGGIYTVLLTVTDAATQTVICTSLTTLNLVSCDGGFQQDAVNHAVFNFWANNVPASNQVVWNFGDGTPAVAGLNVYHTFAAQGIFSVTMSEMDSSGTSTYCSKTFKVMNDSSQTCSFILTQTPNSTGVSVEALVPSSNATVMFNFGGTAGWQTGYSVSNTYMQSGTYTICMNYLNGTDSCTACKQVVILPNTTACSFVYAPDSVNPMLYNFTAVSPNQPAYTYHWDFGDGSTGIGTLLSHTYAAAGQYTVCMNEVDQFLGTTICQTCFVVTVSQNGACDYTTSVIAGTPLGLQFTSTNTTASTYVWDFGDGVTATTTTPAVLHIYTLAGTYTACLSVGSNGAIVCTVCHAIVVNGTSTGCHAQFTQVSLGLTAYFIDQSVAVAANVPPLPSPVNYQWSFGDGNTSSLQFPNHQYSAPGTYTVCESINTPGCADSVCQIVVIDTTITNPSTCNAFFVFTQTSPFNMVAVNLSSGNNLTFMWNFGDGSPINTMPYPYHVYATTGSYQVCLTVADNTGCTSTHCDTLHVDSLGNIFYRGLSTGFTLNVYSPAQLTSGIDEQQPVRLAGVYPVPATDKLFVEWTGKNVSTLNYTVVNVEGQIILSGKLAQTHQALNVSSLANGMYLLRVTDDKGISDSRTFVKQ